jgi:cation:H+ antiporter
LMYFGGDWTVDGAIALARSLGLSEFFISATIVALGTSLPELVTSLIAIRKGEIDLSVGNIIGSNIINIALILGISAIITPIPLAGVVSFDILFLLGSTFLLLLFISSSRRTILKRWHGIVFVVLYLLYLVILLVR